MLFSNQSSQHVYSAKEIEPIRIRVLIDLTMNAELIQSPGQSAVDTEYTIFAKGEDTNITSLNKVEVQSEFTRTVGRRIQISSAGQSLRISCMSEAERRAVRSQSTIVE